MINLKRTEYKSLITHKKTYTELWLNDCTV
jgi:hypothetical protein